MISPVSPVVNCIFQDDMRTNLQVPFAEKDDAKRLGARWDAARKVWYIENKADMSPFARWLPTPNVAAASGEQSSKPSPAGKQQSAGVTIVGNAFAEQPRVCSCPPWEECDKCQASAVAG